MKYDLSIVVIIKNEDQYIEEWILYHKIIGIDHIYIYINDDDSNNVKKILKQYINDKFVSTIDFPGYKKQIPAYNHSVRHFRHESKYLAFIDADEFIFCNNGDCKKTIEDIIKMDKRAGGIVGNWQMFGSAGHINRPEGLVIENYLYKANCDKPGTNCVKSIVNPRKILFFHNPHYPVYMPLWYSINENGDKVRKWNNVISEYPKKISIFHYFTKSKEEWIKRRSVARIDTGKKRQIEEFYMHDNNDKFDDSMLIYAKQIREVLGD